METTTAISKKKITVNYPPFVKMSHQNKLFLMEEINPLCSKKECKDKIRELNENHNTNNLRTIKFEGRYFIYKLK